MRFAFTLLAGVLLAAHLPAAVAAPQPVDLPIITGRGELLTFGADITQVATAEPKIADVVVISPREVMVNAKATGKTTVVVWETGTPHRYDVEVLPDNTEFDRFRKEMLEQLPGSEIQVEGKGETIVLTGKAKDQAQLKRAAALAQTRAKTVVNLLTAPPDPEPKQIVLQVKFASVDRTALKQTGFNLFSRNSAGVAEATTGQFTSPRFSQLQPTGAGQSVNFADLLNLFIYRPDLNIGATIAMLEQQNVAQILAEPNLIVVDGKTASFLAGGSFPFPTITTTSTGGANAPVVNVQFKKFGVQLDFTPNLLPDGTIHLQVAPEVSSLDYSNAVTLQGFLIPALAQRRAETEVILRDGESFAIAGLIDNRVVKTVSKIPGFGNIPILGEIFKSRSTQKTNNELLVVITPRLVKPLSADEKAKLPDFPVPFLSTKPEAGKKGDKDSAEFVGPRGNQEPKKQ